MNLSSGDIQVLGLGGVNAATSDLIIDSTQQTHPILKDCKIDIINLGTLKKIIPGLVIRRNFPSDGKSNVFEEYLIPTQANGYYAEVKSSIDLFGEVTFYQPSKVYNNIVDNNYFNNFTDNGRNINFKGIDSSLEYVRLAFPNSGNTNTLSGFSNRTGVLSPAVSRDLSTIFTGRRSLIASKNFISWTRNRLPGETGTQTLTNVYLPFPNTISLSNFNAYNIPLKLTCYQNYIENDLRGVMLLSTGVGQNERVCYISPHKATTGLQNCLVFENNPIRSGSNLKITSGILVNSIIIDSEYSNTEVFPSGIHDSGSGFSFLQQTTPIKDTAYYQAYSGIYNGAKKLNTGTWNGIIPANTSFRIELVSNRFNTTIGSDVTLYAVYTGYNTNDSTDQNIRNLISASNLNVETNKIQSTNVVITNGKINATGRGRGFTYGKALEEAHKNLKYILYTKISQIIKSNLIEIMFMNKKLRKFLRFKNKTLE